MGKRLNNQGCTKLFTAFYFLVFYSIVEHADGIARELDASAKQETGQGKKGKHTGVVLSLCVGKDVAKMFLSVK